MSSLGIAQWRVGGAGQWRKNAPLSLADPGQLHTAGVMRVAIVVGLAVLAAIGAAFHRISAAAIPIIAMMAYLEFSLNASITTSS